MREKIDLLCRVYPPISCYVCCLCCLFEHFIRNELLRLHLSHQWSWELFVEVNEHRCQDGIVCENMTRGSSHLLKCSVGCMMMHRALHVLFSSFVRSSAPILFDWLIDWLIDWLMVFLRQRNDSDAPLNCQNTTHQPMYWSIRLPTARQIQNG